MMQLEASLNAGALHDLVILDQQMPIIDGLHLARRIRQDSRFAASKLVLMQLHGRSGKPRKLSLAYFALGPRAREQADSYMKHYYGWLGEFADQIAASAAVSEAVVRGYVAAFEQSGCDELILIPSSSELDQVALLAQAVK